MFDKHREVGCSSPDLRCSKLLHHKPDISAYFASSQISLESQFKRCENKNPSVL